MELSKPFTIRLQQKQRQALREYAENTSTSESAIVRQAVALFLSRNHTISVEKRTESMKP
jgi:predicted transcriptional regulator